MVRVPASLFVSSIRARPLPATRTTFPVTVSVPAAASKSVHRSAEQLGAPQPSGDQQRDRVDQVVTLAVFIDARSFTSRSRN